VPSCGTLATCAGVSDCSEGIALPMGYYAVTVSESRLRWGKIMKRLFSSLDTSGPRDPTRRWQHRRGARNARYYLVGCCRFSPNGAPSMCGFCGPSISGCFRAGPKAQNRSVPIQLAKFAKLHGNEFEGVHSRTRAGGRLPVY
jgi:hypothetical protein